MTPEIGEEITFIPSAWAPYNGQPIAQDIAARVTVIGRVTAINWRKRWLRVSYPTDYDGIQHECFMFSDWEDLKKCTRTKKRS